MRVLETIGRLGGIWCCHAENGDLIDYLEDVYHARGEYTAENYLAIRPQLAEVEAAFRARSQHAKQFECSLYLVHTSAAGRAYCSRVRPSEARPASGGRDLPARLVPDPHPRVDGDRAAVG